MVTEESAKETVKAIAQGRPDDLAEPVVTPPAFCLQAGHGCGQHPAFPAPSRFSRAMPAIARARNAPRECGRVPSLLFDIQNSEIAPWSTGRAQRLWAPSFRGVASATNPEPRDSQVRNCAPQFDASHRPGMTLAITAPSLPGSARTRPARRTCSRTTRAGSPAPGGHRCRARPRAPS
jgi:hypothetical protein